ncbi:hypothetical protein BRE01_36590 [Brevibacillus reuszeri]|uniref:Uncharacterized protein n=1 Tax=Brevibacillus reuszeri TaxID=54915 RepID=A0A0K9YPF7_9BACL|nr:hypothetical protein [Brevibacillus reuszeri]KNB70603.1 hypothetical protein ADS79_17030 [Brevibacillus reuszeri]MED1861416.1 hypothetical protein [Brevibacillus reuszeri]GED69957.1 hypothetical protein BRE01_36590 [Brevibacillus reuszeri]
MTDKSLQDMMSEIVKQREIRDGLAEELQKLVFEYANELARILSEGTKIDVPHTGVLEVQLLHSEIGTGKWMTIEGRLIDTRKPGSTVTFHENDERTVASLQDFLKVANNILEIVDAYAVQQQISIDELLHGVHNFMLFRTKEVAGYKTVHVINEGTRDEIRIRYHAEKHEYLVFKGLDYKRNRFGEVFLADDLYQLAHAIDSDDAYFATCRAIRKFMVHDLGVRDITTKGELERFSYHLKHASAETKQENIPIHYGTFKLGDLCDYFTMMDEVSDPASLWKEVTIEFDDIDELEDINGYIDVRGLGRYYVNKLAGKD